MVTGGIENVESAVVNMGALDTGSSLVSEAALVGMESSAFAKEATVFDEQRFSAAVQGVPEPGASSLLAAALLLLLRRPRSAGRA